MSGGDQIFVKIVKIGQDREFRSTTEGQCRGGGRFGEKTHEARLRWFGHVRRKDDWYNGRTPVLPGHYK